MRPVQTHADDGEHGTAPDTATPQPSAAHEPGEAVKAQRTTDRYTTEGMTLNPIAIDFDPAGNLYIAEGWRAGNAVLDNRNGPLRKSGGVIHDLQKTSVQDRAEQIKMLIEGGFYKAEQFTKEADKVRLLRDTDGDGKADESSIYADGFNQPLDGIASGVLFHGGKVYFTNIPHVWLLEDKDGDGDADEKTEGERTSLSYGWGIRWAFYGHDMHGLIKGPDGRIYFSIGDRGYNVKTKEGKQLYGPDRGAVFRMWPDGSGLELYFEGLRNPQELAFDNYGNLFTGDNNSDSGDKARFVYLPEGGDSGWRQDVQSLNDRGPWNREHMWKPRFEKDDLRQPAWIIPPIKNVGRGPSGLAHYPGTGDVFPSNGSFLMCDYPAGVRHVHVKPDGATFKVVEDTRLPTDGDTITDVAWGYDGRLYLSDWGGGWKPNPNGYIKTMVNAAAHVEQAATILEVQARFKQGFESATDDTLIDLLGHRDQRVRLAAQWEFAARDNADPKDLTAVLTDKNASELSRLHAVWTLGMMARSVHDFAGEIEPALRDESPMVRAQAVSTLGDARLALSSTYVKLLSDENAAVQHHAAIALGKTGSADDIGPLLDLLDRNDNDDVAIRHAASYALSLIGDAEAIHEQAKRRGAAARLGGVLALRRIDSPIVADYLNDDDPLVAAEAARAIYDKRITDAMPALAVLCDTLPAERMSEPVMRRVIEANIRLADRDSATRLARLAANADAPDAWRELALQELDQWSAERNREGVWGAWWPRETQDMEHAVAALITYLPAIIGNAKGNLLSQARTLEQRHVAQASADDLATIALDDNEPAEMRSVTLGLLAEADRAKAIVVAGLLERSTTAPVQLRIQSRSTLISLDEQAGWDRYVRVLEQGEMIEKQDAIDRLGKGKGVQSGEAFINLSKSLADDTLAPELRLDVIAAVQGNQALPLEARASVQKYVQANTILGEQPFIRDAVLEGGSVERGKSLFVQHPSAQCQRCHNLNGTSSVGPDLSLIGALYDADYLYTALVKPHADIAEGYATTTMKLKDGSFKTGRIVKDKTTPAQYVLTDADGKQETIPRNQVQGQPVTSDQSMMPTMTDKLSAAQLRDVLAYLGSLKGDGTIPAGLGNSGSVAIAGPKLINPAEEIEHVVWLPTILISIFIGLGALLLATVLGGGKMA